MKPNMLQLFKPGDVIYGFCNGFFGRDDYQTKVCVLVTPKYAVFEWVRSEWDGLRDAGFATVLNLSDRLDPADVAKWKVEESD